VLVNALIKAIWKWTFTIYFFRVFFK